VIKLFEKSVYCVGGVPLTDGVSLADANHAAGTGIESQQLNETLRDGTMAWKILRAHNKSGQDGYLNIRFDALASHDITYVGIIQTARVSGLTEFTMPYALTCCHNSLCAVGGTINEDDHVFGLSAAQKYGGIFVPPHQAVIHQYIREQMAGCGKMILGSDSHTRYGALGCMGVGEGGPELVKQLLSRTWDAPRPEVVGIFLTGAPRPGVGPQDVAIALVGATFGSGFVKNRIMEFFGPGVSNLSVDYRMGIDVMTTETTCLSSIWQTDGKVREYYRIHGREQEYSDIAPDAAVMYDRLITVDLSGVVPMIALPFHPSNAFPIQEVIDNAGDVFERLEGEAKSLYLESGVGIDYRSMITDKGIRIQQGIIAGCSGGTYENIEIASSMLDGRTIGSDEFTLSVYPASQPIYSALLKSGAASKLLDAGAVIKTAFCGPCFGAGDVPRNGALSIRHTTRNFPNREGSKPGQGQLAAVALMDARSIAATAANGGLLTPADQVYVPDTTPAYTFNQKIYDNRLYRGVGRPEAGVELKLGPNIKDWPQMIAMPDDLLIATASVICDEVTTTDELIPSGETSSYRSNPVGLAEFTLSRKDPGYVPYAKRIAEQERLRRAGEPLSDEGLHRALEAFGIDQADNVSFGTFVYANKPGDGSAREQAASCQKVLGGWANIAKDYATKRYRSNCVNWGMLPLTLAPGTSLELSRGDFVYLRGIKKALEEGCDEIDAKLLRNGRVSELKLYLPGITPEERKILLAGCLMNYYRV